MALAAKLIVRWGDQVLNDPDNRFGESPTRAAKRDNKSPRRDGKPELQYHHPWRDPRGSAEPRRALGRRAEGAMHAVGDRTTRVAGIVSGYPDARRS